MTYAPVESCLGLPDVDMAAEVLVAEAGTAQREAQGDFRTSRTWVEESAAVVVLDVEMAGSGVEHDSLLVVDQYRSPRQALDC